MNRPCPRPGCGSLLIGGLLWAAASGLAQSRYQDVEIEPRWLRLDLPQASLGMEVEGFTETRNVGSSSYTHEQLSLVPLVGLRTRGPIYHPNLIAFDLNGEGGWGWLTDTESGSGSSSTRRENADLLRYLAQISVLPGKSYNATFSAAQDHAYRNYDSFSSYTSDTERYSGRFGWVTPALELNADAGYRYEKLTGINGTSEVAETFVNFQGIQNRQTGQSTLTYRYDEFDNTVDSGSHQTSVYNSVGVSDSETFGGRGQIGATTSASFSQAEYSGLQTETVTASESITIKHRPKLESYFNVNFSHNSLDPVTSSFLQGVGGVRHQLYDSLTSTLEAHGDYDESSSPDSSANNDRYGLGLREDYTKRLGGWGRLSLGGGIIADHEDHESSGTVLTTIDEPHVISSSQPFFLKQPYVIVSTIAVRGPGGISAQAGVDYEIIPVGALTGIQLLAPGTNGAPVLKNGDPVLVSYQSESLYNASFESFNGSAQIRLDLFNKFGIYGRVNWLDNNAPPEALTQTLTDLVAGVDYTWRWFRATAEYEDYDSNFSQYYAWRFLQSFNYQSSSASTVGVDLNQNFYRYADNFSQDQYQILARYNTLIADSLTWYLEGGYALQDLLGTEQNYGFTRTGMTWSRGKLSVRAGYEYNYQRTATGPSTEYRERNYFFTYLKRTF